MACLKCGKETEEGKAFCPDCRQVMQKFPVKPTMAVHIPKRPAFPEERKAPRKKQKAEEREKLLRSIIRWMAATIGLLTIIICILSGILLTSLSEEPETNNIGKNYTFVDPTNKNTTPSGR